MNSIVQGFVTSAVLIVIVLILRRFCRGKISPTLQYGIWLLVAVKLLVPVSFGESTFSVLTILGRVESTVLEAKHEEGEPGAAGVAGTDSNTETTYVMVEDSDAVYLPNEQIESVTYPAAEGSVTEHHYEPIEEAGIAETNMTERSWQHPFWQAVPYIIFVNAVLLGVWMLVYNLKFYNCLRRTRIPYVGKEDEEGRSVTESQSKKPHIYLTEDLATPCLFGTSIYLPLTMAQDETKLRHILAHETAHYQHKDFIWSLLRLLCVVLNWYNPFVWLAAAAAKEDCELACDETAIRALGEEERLAYGKTLISLVGAKQAQDAFSVTTTMTGSKKELMRRITLIAEKPVRAVSMVVFTGLILAAAVLFTFTGEVQAAETSAVAEDISQVAEQREEGLLSSEDEYFVRESETAGKQELTPEEVFKKLTSDGTFTVFVRSINRSLKGIDSFDISAEDWNFRESASLQGELVFAEDCLYAIYDYNKEYGSMEKTDVDYAEFVDAMPWHQTSAVECKVTCKDGLVTDITAYNAFGGITYSEPLKDNGYGDMLGKEAYQLIHTYEADVSEAEGTETIKVYAGDAGDGNGGGYVTVEDAQGELLYMNGGYLARAGWNNIYLHEQGEASYLFDLHVEIRGFSGELSYHAFRLDAEGNPLPINGAVFMYEAETYEEENFLQWASSMNVYLTGSHLLLGTQDGVLNTEPAEELEKYEKNTLNQQILSGFSYSRSFNTSAGVSFFSLCISAVRMTR